ncbi:MAG: cytidylate kinase-like family protein, partial [Deltaproteobacteria bacterium]|nr:cytidylate kinase-like family protein [Deltaproteobacteria bacterium]
MPVITISRQFGAGGKTLSTVISKILGYNVYDREVIKMVSEKARVSENWVDGVEKDAGSKLMNFVHGMISTSFLDRLLDDQKGIIDEEIYIDLLQTIIPKIAMEENCVIVGRGGQFILEGKEEVYHIFLIAEKKDRVKFIEKAYNFTASQALKVVNTEDNKRDVFFKKFHKTGHDNPIHYHLVINMSKVNIEKASELVCNLVS